MVARSLRIDPREREGKEKPREISGEKKLAVWELEANRSGLN